MIFQNRYDVIICDYIMDPLNGLEVLNNLRGAGNEIPFILLTGRLKNAKIIRKINSYMNTRYLLKSLDIKKIVSKLLFIIQTLINERQI